MSNAQKDKGKRFEREVAKFLSEVFGLNFMRVASSGAYIGKSNQSRKTTMTNTQIISQRGDIIPPDAFSAVIECKNHRDFSTGFAGILQGENKKLNAWLSEVLLDSEDGAIPYFLVFKITGQKADLYFAMPKAHFNFDYSQSNHSLYKSDRDLWYNIISSKEFKKFKPQIQNVLSGK